MKLLFASALGAAALSLTAQPSAPRGIAPIVDEYLDQFARRHPSIAAGNGIHDRDGDLEDFSARAIRQEVTWLRAFRMRLNEVNRAPFTADEQADWRILVGIIDGWCWTSTRSGRGRVIQ